MAAARGSRYAVASTSSGVGAPLMNVRMRRLRTVGEESAYVPRIGELADLGHWERARDVEALGVGDAVFPQ